MEFRAFLRCRLRALCAGAAVIVGLSVVWAQSCAALVPDGAYGVSSECSRQAAPDVDVIAIKNGAISDIEDTCEIAEPRLQPDGIVRFEARCASDTKPRTDPGFFYQIDEDTIILDYGLGPSIWHVCVKP